MLIALQERYRPRPVRFIELWDEGGWRLKVYGIAYDRQLPRPELVAAAKRVARERLAQSAEALHHYGVGFLGVHDGRGGNFIFLGIWADENELYQHVYASPKDQPGALSYVTTGLTACVWDLWVMGFERQAWVDSVLDNPGGANLDAYLHVRLNADV